MNTRYSIFVLLSVTATLGLTSCVYTENALRSAQHQAYQSGVADGRAASVRQSYHQRQQAKEQQASKRPPAPPRRRYYEVPIPAHTTSDGVKIEAHTQPISIIQP